MEVIALGIYSFFMWLIFKKLKWLPWNITSQVIVVTIPIIAIVVTLLLLNIVAPSTHDVRVMNYVVPIVPRVTGRVISVPVEPNRPIKKGDILFKIDPVPFEQEVKKAEAKLAEATAKVAGASAYERELNDQMKAIAAKTKALEARIPEFAAKLLTAGAYERELQDQLAAAAGKRVAAESRLALARQRAGQHKELEKAGAGTRFDLEQAEADVRTSDAEVDSAKAGEAVVKQKLSARPAGGDLSEVAQAKAMILQVQADVEASRAAEAQIAQKLSARTASGELAEVAQAKAQVLQCQSELDSAKWDLEETVVRAPTDGTVVGLALREGAVATKFAGQPVMSFVENEQWVIALYSQNELRDVEAGNESEIILKTHPGRVIKCKVDSIMWATAQGQLPISGSIPQTGGYGMPPGRIAVRMAIDDKDKELFLAAGAGGHGAIYTEHGKMLHIMRKVMLRVATKLDWVIPKLH